MRRHDRTSVITGFMVSLTRVVADPYVAEPLRHPALYVVIAKPFNAETPLDILADSFITPNELFYVRNHLAVPEVSIADYRLEVEGEGVRSIQLSMDDLK